MCPRRRRDAWSVHENYNHVWVACQALRAVNTVLELEDLLPTVVPQCLICLQKFEEVEGWHSLHPCAPHVPARARHNFPRHGVAHAACARAGMHWLCSACAHTYYQTPAFHVDGGARCPNGCKEPVAFYSRYPQ